jgi:opacity protein-like surface antigen
VTFASVSTPVTSLSADASILAPQKKKKGQGDGDQPERPHHFAFGFKFGGGYASGFGFTVRDWLKKRIAFQVDASRFGFNGGQFGSFHLTQIAPSLLFALGKPDLTKNTHVRPYLGLGLNLNKFSYSAAFSSDKFSGYGLGYQVFVGAEFVMRQVPFLGIGGDIGYYSAPNAGAYFTGGGIAVTLTAHFYFN